MKSRVFLLPFFWSLAAYGQLREPSSDFFKQDIFDALQNLSLKALQKLSKHTAIIPENIFENAIGIDFSNTVEFNIQRFVVRPRKSNSQKFDLEVAFLKVPINRHSEKWVIANMRKIDKHVEQTYAASEFLKNLDIASLRRQKGLYPSANEFNFIDFKDAIVTKDAEVLNQVKKLGFQQLADSDIDLMAGTKYVISGVKVEYASFQSIVYDLIAQYLPISKYIDKSGWHLTNIFLGAPEETNKTKPIISEVLVADKAVTSVKIMWKTNKPADSQIEYGLSTAYGNTTNSTPPLVTSQSQQLSGLTPNTTYHFRVLSRDKNGNLAISDDDTFTTAAPLMPPAPIFVLWPEFRVVLSDGKIVDKIAFTNSDMLIGFSPNNQKMKFSVEKIHQVQSLQERSYKRKGLVVGLGLTLVSIIVTDGTKQGLIASVPITPIFTFLGSKVTHKKYQEKDISTFSNQRKLEIMRGLAQKAAKN